MTLRNIATAALCFWFSASLTACPEACPNGTKWQPAVTQQDHRDCVFAAGDTRSIYDYPGCLRALGYREACQ